MVQGRSGLGRFCLQAIRVFPARPRVGVRIPLEKPSFRKKVSVLSPSRSARAGLAALSLVSLGWLVAGCDSPEVAEPSAAPKASSPVPHSLPELREGWKTRWTTFPPLPACEELAPSVAPACVQTVAKRQALKEAEEKGVESAQHLTLAAAAAEASATAATQLERAYIQRLLLNAGTASASAAPSAGAPPVASAPPARSADPHHDHAQDGIKQIIEHAKHGESRDRDPVLGASTQYFGAERDALLRLAGYIRAGSPTEREQALGLLERHAERFPKSQRTRQIVAETSVIVSDEAVRARLGAIRSKLSPASQ